MSDFSTEKIAKANKTHRCSECRGAISPGEKYERVFLVYQGDSGAYKTCMHCVSARNWLMNDADWPDDIDGEGHQWFYTMLREHLMDQARNGARKFALRAYRHIALMDRRRKAWADAYNAETVKIRERQMRATA